MAKLTQTQATIAQAFASYKNGSTAVVRAFEMAIHGYWHTDSCNPTNLQFFLNASKRFPVLQKVAITLLKQTDEKALAYLNIKKDKASGEYVITNAKDITKEMKVKARQNVAAFIACEYTSLTHEKSVKVNVEFTQDMAAKSIKASITNNLKKMLAENADTDVALLMKMVNDSISEVFTDASIAKIKAAAIVAKAA